MAVAFVAGTTAEIIKLAPLMRVLQDDGRPYELWNTAQHVDGLRAVLDDLRLPQPDEHFIAPDRQTPLVRSAQVPGWAARVLGHAARRAPRLRRRLRAAGGRPLVVVHGDTFTTVLGALVGRVLLGASVAHVEAGMRSGNLWHPMPEELNRRLVARLAHVHFAPTEDEVAHLRAERGVRGDLVSTGANTVVDAVRMTMSLTAPLEELPETFGLVTLHRFELLRNGPVFTRTLEVLHDASRSTPLVMMAGDTERNRIADLRLERLFDEVFRLVPKRPYTQFLPLLGRAAFVVTDSGGLQQECAVLGLPCAVHRLATESRQGLGANLLLTHLDMGVLRDFLAGWQEFCRPSQLDEYHPSQLIVERLGEQGFLPPPRG